MEQVWTFGGIWEEAEGNLGGKGLGKSYSTLKTNAILHKRYFTLQKVIV